MTGWFLLGFIVGAVNAGAVSWAHFRRRDDEREVELQSLRNALRSKRRAAEQPKPTRIVNSRPSPERIHIGDRWRFGREN